MTKSINLNQVLEGCGNGGDCRIREEVNGHSLFKSLFNNATWFSSGEELKKFGVHQTPLVHQWETATCTCLAPAVLGLYAIYARKNQVQEELG